MLWATRSPSLSTTTQRKIMQEDKRCCGSGTCIINEEGVCWCGQRWDGEKMCFDVQAPTPDEPKDNE